MTAREVTRETASKAAASTARTTPYSAPVVIYVHDLLMAGFGMAATILVRYQFETRQTPYANIWTAVAVFVAVCAVVFPLMRLNRPIWRYTTLNDVLRCAQAAVVANLLLFPVLFAINRLADFPRSTPFIATLFVTLLLSAGRVLTHLAASGDLRAVLRFQDKDRAPAVVIGTAADASHLLQAMRRSPEDRFRVCGIISLDQAAAGRTLHGAEVIGRLSDLTPVLKALTAREGRAPQVVLADRRPTRALLDQVVAAAGEAGCTVARARPAAGSGAALTPVQAADLLARPPRNLNVAAARGLVEGCRVLVTGAGGTIGSELTRQIANLNPERLILLDASEYNLYAIDHELREAGVKVPWTAELGDVRDLDRLNELWARERPEVVLHAAALKHVPLMEVNPAEAVLTNLGGAINVARLSRETAKAFVFISTDKAVNPTNVMGATKRVAERAVQALAPGGSARAAVVRFGNVLGSNGSVVPLFERQIGQGGPLTLTHPDMVRYFMTVQEASSLVLQAASLPADPGQAFIYVLDMGDPVRIEDLARQLIRLHGLRPDKDIKIVHTGLRPGEKLFEEIFYAAEDVRDTAADGVLEARADHVGWIEVEDQMDGLIAAASRRDQREVIDRLKGLEPAFKPAG
jgi:FlaA1/EpsC-like NDP-sugar epimerase